MAEPGNKNPAVDPAEGGSQEVGERMGSLETQLSQLTTLVSSLVENQRELVSSLVEQQGEKVESSGFVAAAPGGGGPETSMHLSARNSGNQRTKDRFLNLSNFLHGSSNGTRTNALPYVPQNLGLFPAPQIPCSD